MEDNSLKTTIFVVLGSLILIAGIIGVAKLFEKPDQVAVSDAQGEARHVRGNKDAEISIVEFSDFQCPACGAAEPVVSSFIEEFSNQVSFVYRHMPLPYHQNARPTAYAAEAAANQGKFWEVHDWLFANQSVWEESEVSGEYFFEKFGETFGLDKDTFLNDYKSNDVRDRVSQDASDANQLGVNSTPTFYINGTKHEGGFTRDELIEITGVSVDTMENSEDSSDEASMSPAPTEEDQEVTPTSESE